MSKFSSAFSAGRAAANNIETANREIDEIFRQLKNDILEATGKKIEILLLPAGDFMAGLAGFSRTLAEGAPVPSEGAPKRFYVTARNKVIGRTSSEQLARLVRPFEGYPCELAYANVTDRCHDGEALTAALADMLGNAWVANKLLEIENKDLTDGK